MDEANNEIIYPHKWRGRMEYVLTLAALQLTEPLVEFFSVDKAYREIRKQLNKTQKQHMQENIRINKDGYVEMIEMWVTLHNLIKTTTTGKITKFLEPQEAVEEAEKQWMYFVSDNPDWTRSTHSRVVEENLRDFLMYFPWESIAEKQRNFLKLMWLEYNTINIGLSRMVEFINEKDKEDVKEVIYQINQSDKYIHLKPNDTNYNVQYIVCKPIKKTLTQNTNHITNPQ